MIPDNIFLKIIHFFPIDTNHDIGDLNLPRNGFRSGEFTAVAVSFVLAMEDLGF